MPKSKLFTDYIFRFVQRLFFIRDKRRQPKPNLAIGRTFVPLKRRSKVLPEVSYVILGYSDIVRSTAPHRTGFETMQEARGRGNVPRVDATGTGHGPPLFRHGPTAVTETSFASGKHNSPPSLTESSFAPLFPQWRAQLVRIMTDGFIFCLEI